MRNSQSANAVMMIRPARFGFNETTAESNVFQKKTDLSADEAQSKAFAEFNTLHQTLTKAGVSCEVFDDIPDPPKPDAVFPNNWISFQSDGTVFLFPLQAPNRRLERRQDIVKTIQQRYRVLRVIDLSEYERNNLFLEGTGSMVLDHPNRIIYAALSSRTHPDVLQRCARDMGYTPIAFHATDARGNALYHTNVMMSIGTDIAVICSESIPDPAERKLVVTTLEKSGRTILPISLPQVDHFVGNMLELTTVKNKRIIAMSDQALQALTPEQRSLLECSAHIVSVAIPTIETIGGGSVRCMLAEIFLSRK